MRPLINFFINRPTVVNLASIMIVIVGTLSLIGLQKEVFPQVDFDTVVITTAYPRASAEDVEKMVTMGIERSLKGVDGIKDLTGLSSEGMSTIIVQIDPDFELPKVLTDIKDFVNRISDFPSEVEDPIVTTINNKHRGVIKVTLSGNNQSELSTTSKALRDKLELINSITNIKLKGYSQDEIRVEINPVKLASFDLTYGQVAAAIKDRNINLSAGRIEHAGGDIIVRTVSEYNNLSDIKNVVVRSNTTGRKVLVKEIAKVMRKPIEGSILERSMGEPSIFLEIFTKEKADIIDSVDEIKLTVNEFMKNWKYKSVRSRFTDDMSFYVKRRLNILSSSAIYGMILVFVSLLLFLNFRTSLITSFGAPIAFLAAFMVMDYFGFSLNMISMFSLILVLGMLVDDAIIVAEHFYQKLEKGVDPRTAAQEASYETIAPVSATVITTMIAFGAMLFMGGIMGKFIWQIPIIVILCLSASLLECFFILPSHLAEFAKISKKRFSLIKFFIKGYPDNARWYDPILKFYGKVLNKALNHPVKVCFFFLLVFAFSLFVAKGMRLELFPGDDSRIVFIQLKGEPGIPLEKTDKAMSVLEKMAIEYLRAEDFEQVRAKVGTLMGMHGDKKGSHYASMILYLTPPDERERSTDKILSDLSKMAKKGAPDYSVTVKRISGGPPKGSPIDIQLMGDSLTELKKASLEIIELVKKTPGVTSSDVDFEDGKKQIVVEINEAEAKRLGLSTTTIAVELRKVFGGDSVTQIREADEDIDVKLFLDDISIKDAKTLSKLSVMNSQGRRIPIRKIVKFKNNPGAFEIRRLNRRRIFSIVGTIDKEKTTSLRIAETLRPNILKVLKKYPSLIYKFGGEREDTAESMQRLVKSGLIALFFIYIVLVLMFNSLAQPIVVMMAIPLGMVGVIFTFKLRGLALGFMAFMGIVALIGVVVNDSIVLVTFINKQREKVDNLVEAVHRACISRFRAVILTTITTVAGLMPLAESQSDPFIKPMAISFAWGLLIATVVTLIFIPCNYIAYVNTYKWLSKKLKGFKKIDVSKRSKKFLQLWE